jgi:hypothetical protein
MFYQTKSKESLWSRLEKKGIRRYFVAIRQRSPFYSWRRNTLSFTKEKNNDQVINGVSPTGSTLLNLTYPLPSPEGGRAAEAFQSLFSHIDGKIRDGYGGDGCGRNVVITEKLILTQYSPYLWYETYHDVMVWGNL